MVPGHQNMKALAPRLLLATLLLAIATLPAPSAFSKSHNLDGVARTTRFPFHGKLKAVDLLAQTFTLEGKSARVFAVTPQTKITKDGAPATLQDATPGQAVTGYSEKSPEGQLTALSLSLSPGTATD